MRKSLSCLLCATFLAVNLLCAAPLAGAYAPLQKRRDAQAAGGQIAVAVTNELKGGERALETVELAWSDLASRLPGLKPGHVLVTDLSTGKRIASQSIDLDSDGRTDQLIFQTGFASRERDKVFLIEASAEAVPAPAPKTFGRYVPERLDDFAWENDRIAFRTYGPALEQQMVSSGIDVWAKRTRNLVIDKWYKLGEAEYHKDSGEGLDLYSVKLTRGCGGSGIWDGRKLHVSRNYKSWKVIANGPLRTVFELTYEPWDAGGVSVSEVKRITLDAGQNLNRIESTLRFDGRESVNYAFGVARHKNWKGTADQSREQGWFSRWEDTGANGSLGCAVAIDPRNLISFAEDEVSKTDNEDLNHLIVTTAEPGKPVRYYAGAGWDRSGDFANRQAWNRYLNDFARRLASPLKVSYLKRLPARNEGGAALSKLLADTVLAQYPDPKELNMRGWDYHNGVFLSGLFELWQRDKDQRYFQYLKSWADLYVDDEGRIGEKVFDREEYQLDDVLPGRLLISLYRTTKDERYRKAAHELTEHLKRQPRTAGGGYWHKKVYAGQMWLDGIYMAGPYAVEFAHAFGEPALFDEAARQLTLIHKLTHDPRTGLLYHGWDESKSLVWANPQTGASPEFWARAVGWYMMALVDELDYLPKSHPARPEYLRILRDLSASLLKYQDARTGLWYQVLDKGERPDNWHETSATAMFIYAFAKGARLGYLDRKYAEAARRAYRALLDDHLYVDDAGRVYFTGTVFVGTLNPKTTKGDYASYVNTPRQTNDAKGVAALLWAALEMEKAGRRA